MVIKRRLPLMVRYFEIVNVPRVTHTAGDRCKEERIGLARD